MGNPYPVERVAGLVLIGGRSRRMGQDKAALLLEGAPMWQHAADVLRPLVDAIYFVGAFGTSDLPAEMVLEDDPPGLGPLGGIANGLERSGYDHHLVLAVDYPLVQQPLLRLLLDKAPGAWAVCGRGETFLEPLVAYYHARCAPTMRQMAAEGELRTYKIFERVPSVILTKEEYDALDPERLSQINVNTPDNWQRALRIMRQQRQA